MSTDTLSLELHYGAEQPLQCQIEAQQMSYQHAGLQPLADVKQELHQQLSQPRGFPPLNQAIVPGDQIILALDEGTPEAELLILEIGQALQQAGAAPDNIRVFVGVDGYGNGTQLNWSRNCPYEVHCHQPEADYKQAYLASTAEGQRIYLPKQIVEADFIITIGRFQFDDHLGYRGTHSVIYPGLASSEVLEQIYRHRSHELSPDVPRPLRQSVDEVGWLLGLQLTVQVIPAIDGSVGLIMAGMYDQVYRECTQLLNRFWTATPKQRFDNVMIAIPQTGTSSDWAALAKACQSARQLVSQDGRVILLSSHKDLPQEFQRRLQMGGSPAELRNEFQQSRTALDQAFLPLMSLLDWASVLWWSELPDEAIENLFCIPVKSDEELKRSLTQGDNYAVINAGQFLYVDTANLK